jgi:phosphate transport system permease protein
MTAIPLPTSFSRQETLHARLARLTNRLIITLCCTAALATIAALFCIFGDIAYEGIRNMHLSLFTQLPKPPDETGGMRNAIAGTLVLIALGSTAGIPIGLLGGIYLAEYARENLFNHALRLVIDVLASVPSILVGIVAYQLVVIPMGFNSAWAGALALGFMMCPIVARTTEDMLKLVPTSLREASIGLGGSKFQTLTKIILPAARAGIITGIMLAVARVAGETAPLLFTTLDSNLPVFSRTNTFPWFLDTNNAFPSLTVHIFKYATSGEPQWIHEAWAGMFVLITIVLSLNLAVRYTTRRTTPTK